jgi:sugar phosphate isomerase/epimerase
VHGIGLCYPGAENIDLLRSTGYAYQLADMATQYRLQVCNLHLGYLCGAPFLVSTTALLPWAKDIIRSATEVAARAQAPVVILPFYGNNRIGVSDEFHLAVKTLREVAGRADDLGVTIAVQSDLSGSQARELLRQVDRRSVKICLDTGSAFAYGFDPAAFIQDVGADEIVQVHLKDVRLPDGRTPDFNVRLGQGDADCVAVIQTLRAGGFEGWLVLDTPRADNPEAAVKMHMNDLRRLLDQTGEQACETPGVTS